MEGFHPFLKTPPLAGKVGQGFLVRVGTARAAVRSTRRLVLVELPRILAYKTIFGQLA